ncbi:MAG: mechanosensitive ion channel family protein [Anaerolineales bacterium]
MGYKRILAALVILLGVMLSACSSTQNVETAVPSATSIPTETPAGAEVESTSQPDAVQTEDGSSALLLNTPTPKPTATPGPLTEIIGQFSDRTGADEVVFLGLTLEDWLNLGVSLLIFLGLVLVVERLVYALLERAAARAKSKYIGVYLKRIRRQISWLVAIFGLQYGTVRLGFLGVEAKSWLDRGYTALYILDFTWLAWALIDIVVEWYREEIEPKHPEQQTEAIVVLLSRGARFFLVGISLIMLLSLYNIDVSGLVAALGIAGLAISLAAQDTLSNMISGVIILLDRPFRVGDRIEIQGLGTWGDVLDIGLRSTRIRTRDNRMVIVPNAKIGSDQVINYSYPDPQYRIEMEIGIGYGQDIEVVRQTIIAAVRPVEGVLQDRPVEALYVKMAEQAMMFRIRWWIESYVDTRRMFDKVNTALQKALDEASIECPYPTYNLQVKKEE